MGRLNLEQLESREVPATVGEAVQHFMAAHTAAQFQEEYWNLLGMRPNAYLTGENRELAGAFGIDDRGFDVLSKAYVMKWTTAAELHSIRTQVADAMTAVPGLGDAQRQFMEWNYRADPKYANVLDNGRTAVVGWDRDHAIAAGGDWTMYTFPLLGCTAVVAYTPAGDGYFSHFAGVANVTQVRLLGGFLDSHPDATVVVIGINSVKAARAIAALPNAPSQIFTHVKKEYMGLSYFIRASWHEGGLSIGIESRPTDGQAYLESCLVSLNPVVVFNYPAGHAWEALPGGDAAFLPVKIFPYTAVVAGTWNDSLGNVVRIEQRGMQLSFVYNDGQAFYTGMLGLLNQVVFTNAAGEVTAAGCLSADQDVIRFGNGVVFVRRRQ